MKSTCCHLNWRETTSSTCFLSEIQVHLRISGRRSPRITLTRSRQFHISVKAVALAGVNPEFTV
jgi:hypothetical protein